MLKWNGTTWTPANDVGGSSGDNWGAQTVQTAGAALSGNGTAGSPLALAQQGAANGQALKWNGTAWAPANDQSATVSAGTGISVSQNGATFTVTNNAPDQPITLNGAGATAVSGTYPTFTIATPAPLDNSPTNELQTLSLNGSTLSLSNGGGSVALPVSPTYSAGTGISLNGTVINNTGDTNAADDITTGSAAGGDLSGTYPNPSVAKLQGKAVAATAPVDGDLLRYNGTNGEWEPVAGNSLGWGLNGNSGTDPGVNFVGTTDTRPVSFRVGGVERMKLWGDGRLELFNEQMNTIVGENAGSANSGGFENNFYGYEAGFNNTTGYYNNFYGSQAGFNNTTGSHNNFYGIQTGYWNTTGFENNFFGFGAGFSNTTGSENNFFGYGAGNYNTTGSRNSFFGKNTGLFNTIGSNNSFLGESAGNTNTAGSQNIFLGNVAGANNRIGNNNTCVGSYSDLADTLFTNGISFGSSSIATASNSARIGNTSVTSIGGQVNWTAFSDGRFKTGVQEDVRGLDFIRRLRPVTYRYDIGKIDEFLGIPERRREQGRAPAPEELDAQRKAADIRYSGFIAQEVEQAARELGYDFSGVDAPDNDKDPYGLRYAEFTVPLVKAVQEQQAMIEAQQNQLKDLNEQVQALMKEVQVLKAVRAKGTEK